jgi:hypothetical protein
MSACSSRLCLCLLGDLGLGDLATVSVDPFGGLITELVDTVPQQILRSPRSNSRICAQAYASTGGQEQTRLRSP